LERYLNPKEKKKAIRHFETAIGIASPFHRHNDLFWNHFSLVKLFRDEGEFDDANIHAEQTKLHSVNGIFKLGRAMQMQAGI
jgi:hypothetical protein